MSEMEMCSFVTATSNMTVEENQNTKLESGTNDQQQVCYLVIDMYIYIYI